MMNLQKNILILDHFNQIGGGQLYILDILERLNKDNFQIYTMDSHLHELHETLKKLDVTVLPVISFGWKDFFKPWRIILTLIELAHAVRKYQIDIIHTNTVWCQCIASVIKILYNRSILWSYHDMAQFDWLGAWFKIFLGLFSERIVVPSKASANKFKFYPEKILIIENGFNFEKFECIPQCTPMNNEKIVVSWIGRLIPWKNVECLLYAAKIIKDQNLFIEFRIYGDGKKKYMRRIHSLVKQLHIENMINLKGFVSAIPQCIFESDLIVNTSIKPESFGRTLIEAALCRKAVIATSLGATREVVVHNKTGILIPPDDPSALAEALIYMVENPQHRKQMEAYAFERAQKKYNLDRIVDQLQFEYISLYDKCLMR